MDRFRDRITLFPFAEGIKEEAFFLFIDQDTVDFTEHGMIGGYHERGQGRTAGKNLAAKLRKGIGKAYFSKRVTGRKGIITNRSQRFGKLYASQASAFRKSFGTNLFYRIRDLNGKKG